MIPTGPSFGPKNSLSLRVAMNSTAAGQRFSSFSFSCRNDAGGRTMRFTSRDGFSSAWRKVNAGFLLSFVTNWP